MHFLFYLFTYSLNSFIVFTIYFRVKQFLIQKMIMFYLVTDELQIVVQLNANKLIDFQFNLKKCFISNVSNVLIILFSEYKTH